MLLFILLLFTLKFVIYVVCQDVTSLLPEWVVGIFYLAKYYDTVMPTVTDKKLEKQGNLIRYIVIFFGQ